MSALLAAAHELRVQADRYVTMAGVLEAIAQSLDASHQTPAAFAGRLERDVQASRPASAATRAPSASPKTGKPHQAKGPTHPQACKAEADQVAAQARILELLAKAKDPLSSAELALRSSLTPYRVGLALSVLVKAKRLLRLGATSSTRYSLSANGAVVAKPAKGGEFEAVWTGTKERAGQAPPLSSVNRGA
jgi:hypothetical protein